MTPVGVDFVFVTGNPGKLTEVRRLVGRPIESIDVDLPEIQSLDLARVLRAKADAAARAIEARAIEARGERRGPFVVEETGLELEALNGFPGPLVKWLLEAVGADGIAGLGHALGEPAVRARCRLLYRDGEREVEAEGITEGTLVLPGRGEHGFGWDPVFQPAGESRTYGELSDADKDRLGHRGRAWRRLAEALDSTR